MQLNVPAYYSWVIGVCLFLLASLEAQAQEDSTAVADTSQADSVQAAVGLSGPALPLFALPWQYAAGDTTDWRLPDFPEPWFLARPFPVWPPALWYVRLPGEETRITRDSLGYYSSRRWLGELALSDPYRMTFDEFEMRSFEEAKRSNWQELIAAYTEQTQEGGGLLDFQFDLPAGEQSAFSTIFGRPTVDLSINGTANLNVGASISTTENPEVPPDQQTQVDPTFEQDLQLNIQGTIGDKLTIATDWDTERPFDFMNRLSIRYQGYEDEILQSIEMGNVSMETGNSLMRGGSALFGVKSTAQLGALRLTSVLSQQEGQGRTETITGGAQEQEISIRPANYENDTHFFIDFFPRQQFEQNMSDPQQLGQALQLSEINVWMLRQSSQASEGERQAIAMVDLGVRQGPDGSYLPPDEARDAFPESLLNPYRNPSTGVSAADFGVDPDEFTEGYFIPLQEGTDYEVHRSLGFISVNRSLNSRQAVAVSFKYVDPQTGQTVSVGDVSQGGSSRLFLKLVRPQNVTTSNAAWDLMLKNVYSTGVQNLTADGLELDIKFTEQNVPSSSLPGRSSILLQDLGLDRVDRQGATAPDNQVDFSTGTLNPVEGTVIFPYLEPFGSRIAELLQESGQPPDRVSDLAFTELYEEKKVNAEQVSKNSFYRIEGQAKGSVSDSYSLGISLVEGSVEVYANGTRLQEGTDYVVDYSIGSITILNDRYLQRGQEIRIEYENNQFAQIEQKGFTGLRAEYTLAPGVSIGGTYLKLKEKPLQDKIRIGNEPVNNTAIGFDATAQGELPWLTRALDQVPLLQTTATSSISLSGEFAQLRPDVSQTNAVEDAIRNNRLFEDEENGLVFIDDFEGADIGLSFMNPSRWSLAAAPAAVPGYRPDQQFFNDTTRVNPSTNLPDKIARSDLRSQFSWYAIPRNITEILEGTEFTPESKPVAVTDVFPNRDVLSEENFITTLDIHYDPTHRGSYNYNENLHQLLQAQPDRTWGGMVTTLPSGQEDLTQNNIEFLEFWVQPVLPGAELPTSQDLEDYEGKIYIDIGTVSEDVVPNFKTNSEDGLAQRPDDLQPDNLGGQTRSYIPSPPPPPEGQFSNELRALEDVGLDGMPNREGFDGINEQAVFATFLESVRQAWGTESPEFQQALEDPSNDDYVYYGEEEVSGLPLHERFHRMYGFHDGNTPPNTAEKRAVTNRPDSEGLITPSNVEQNNAYFQYEIDWNPADFSELEPGSPGTYIVDEIPAEDQQDRWYQVRIPLEDFMRRVGDIENFQNISYIRLWFSGYEQAFTMRFATFELVGSQWRPAENVSNEQPSTADFSISSVNIEENSRRRPIPYRQPEGAIRATNRSRQRQTIANEQSLVLQARGLGPGELKMVKRVYPGGMNMIHYSNLRMFVHGEGYDSRDEAELVMRFGTDLTNNYYEYRQPVTPSDEDYRYARKPLDELTEGERLQEAEQVWLYEENSMNLVMRALNRLKQLRDQQQMNTGEIFESTDMLPDAPPGAVLAVKGNPSLDRIGEIGMGIRNPYNPQNPEAGGTGSLDAEFWLNELRVSGFDNKRGWAANAKMEVQVADFARFNANVARETDGFGALDSRMGQRRVSDVWSYDLSSTFSIDKFLPERYGWNIPLSLATRRSTSTPRYLPNQGDVRLSEFREAVNARDLGEEQKQRLIDQKVHEIQTFNESYSVSLSNVGKQGSSSKLARATLDNTTLNYVYNTGSRRNPEFLFNDNWNYSGSLNYGISFDQTQLFRPFGFLGDVPLLHPLAGLRLGYTPASVNASAGITREYEERRRRLQDNASSGVTPPLQQSHIFNYSTSFGFGYNLTPSIKTSFQTRTVFDLSRAGIEQAGLPGEADSTRFRVRPSFDVLEDLVFDSLRSRRNDYEEQYTAAWDPRLDRIEALEWVSYSANYGGGYQWENSPVGSGLGSTLTNNLTLDQSLDFDMEELLAGRTRIQNVEIAFNISKNAMQRGYGGDSQIFHMFRNSGQNYSPPFSYRTGFGDRIGLAQLIDNPFEDRSIQIPSSKRIDDELHVDSRWEPFQNFTVDLTWNVQWDVTSSRSITLNPDESTSIVQSRSGNVSSSVWNFGSGYGKFFRKQLQTAFDDLGVQGDTLSDAAGNRDGRIVMGRKSLEEDFRTAFLSVGSSVVGKQDFMPLPLPGWQVTWSGLERYIPYFGNFMARASLSHSYSGSYRLGWEFNADTGELPALSLGRYAVTNFRQSYEPNTINIQKSFSPLVGLSITWDSNLRTNFQYEYSKLTSLSLSNTTVIERLSRGVTMSFGYTIRDLRLPFFPTIRNAVDVTINGSYIEDTEQKFRLDSDLDNALVQPPQHIDRDVHAYGYASSFTGGQSRINGSAVIGYQFSQTIRANFEYTYSRLIPKSSGIYARTDHDLRFNVVVSIQSN
ncbi:MAG: cell surface protein SprA [Balneolaceae bacterium]|nr:cell surface protein SprA [Balneolaceae bacterium]